LYYWYLLLNSVTVLQAGMHAMYHTADSLVIFANSLL